MRPVETPDPPGAPWDREGDLGRRLRRIGLWLLVLATFLPYHGCRVHPSRVGSPDVPPPGENSYDPDDPGVRGGRIPEWFVREKLLGQMRIDEDAYFFSGGKATDDFLGPSVFLALPFWALSLLLVRLRGDGIRLAVGLILLVFLGVVFLLSAVALYGGRFDPGDLPGMGNLGATVALGIAGAALLLRPRGRLGIRDVEASVSAQAQLGLLLLFATPVLQSWTWIVEDGHRPVAVLRAHAANYRVGFWVALAGLLLVVAPLHFSGDALRRLYDRLRPWASRSSTPTPTSTSRSSTGTASRSSSAPAPPGSSPS
jgi:hypothetical protein